MSRLLKFSFSMLLFFSSSLTHAAIILGPGDIATSFNDTDADLIAVDLANSSVLSAGTYTASTFNYQFVLATGQNPPSLGGSVRPFLATFNGSDYRVIALGDAISYNGASGFVSTPFGGTSTFTLNQNASVYPAFFWDGTITVNRNPIGAANFGSTFLRYTGANPPSQDGFISGGNTLCQVALTTSVLQSIQYRNRIPWP